MDWSNCLTLGLLGWLLGPGERDIHEIYVPFQFFISTPAVSYCILLSVRACTCGFCYRLVNPNPNPPSPESTVNNFSSLLQVA